MLFVGENVRYVTGVWQGNWKWSEGPEPEMAARMAIADVLREAGVHRLTKSDVDRINHPLQLETSFLSP